MTTYSVVLFSQSSATGPWNTTSTDCTRLWMEHRILLGSGTPQLFSRLRDISSTTPGYRTLHSLLRLWNTAFHYQRLCNIASTLPGESPSLHLLHPPMEHYYTYCTRLRNTASIASGSATPFSLIKPLFICPNFFVSSLHQDSSALSLTQELYAFAHEDQNIWTSLIFSMPLLLSGILCLVKLEITS